MKSKAGRTTHLGKIVVMLSSPLFFACGGQSSITLNKDAAPDIVLTPTGTTLATSATSATSTLKTTSIILALPKTPIQPVSPINSGSGNQLILGAVTEVKIENIATSAQTQLPVTFAQVFAQGDVGMDETIIGKLINGSTLPLQVDVKARHADGSLRHAVISAVLPQLTLGETQIIGLLKSTGASISSPSNASLAITSLLNTGFTASVKINIGGQIYTSSAEDFLKIDQYTSWLSGSTVNEWLVSAPLKNAEGFSHPHLMARFAIRSYADINKARVDVTLENNWAYEPGPQNFTYDAQVVVGGQVVFSQAALKHYHHARWHKSFWWGAAPQVHVRHNSAYLMASKALPNYDTSFAISSTALNNLDAKWSASSTSPMGPGIVTPAMPMGGGRPDIGPLPQWAAMYLLSMDSRAKKITLGVGDLAGSWPIHYRDKKTDMPILVSDYPYMTLLGRPGDAINPLTGKSELFPVCGGDCGTTPYNYNPDGNHQPSLAYMPYLVTGDYYYLEELHFWANWNMIQANPYYRDFDKGLMKWNEIRGQAWSLRTLGHAAYITPDNHPMKKYFVDRVGYNLDFYNTTYTNGNPNQLGVIDGTGKFAFMPIAYTAPSGVQTGLSPWMDDFFTWSVGYLAELGFTKASPLLAWKAKFPVGRMTAPGYCWIDGATYALEVRPSASSPLYTTLGEAYRATMRNPGGSPMVNSTGAKYLDQACGSQALADWRTQSDKDNGVRRGAWSAGEMDGFATFAEGFPSNMQPALAVAATSGVPNAQTAWSVFINRPIKPDYSIEPQWAIVPRK